MLPTPTLLSKSIKSLSFCLTASVNSAYLNKCHYCKPNVSYYPYQKITNISFPLTGVSCSKSATVITERPTNTFSGIIINISPNLESISVHKLFDTIESSSIINNFIYDNLFLKAALDLSFKPSNFVPGLIARPE